MKEIKSVDAYIAALPRGVQVKLIELRRIIKAAAPQAVERISYGMPYYEFKGRLAYFRTAKSHVGLYIPPPIVSEHKKELKNYGTSTATIRFPLDKKLPAELIKKLIKARVKRNEEQQRS